MSYMVTCHTQCHTYALWLHRIHRTSKSQVPSDIQGYIQTEQLQLVLAH